MTKRAVGGRVAHMTITREVRLRYYIKKFTADAFPSAAEGEPIHLCRPFYPSNERNMKRRAVKRGTTCMISEAEEMGLRFCLIRRVTIMRHTAAAIHTFREGFINSLKCLPVGVISHVKMMALIERESRPVQVEIESLICFHSDKDAIAYAFRFPHVMKDEA